MSSRSRLRRSEGGHARVWHALADASRRTILDLLRDGPQTTTQIADRFPVTRFAVMKHLSVLEAAGLVVVRRQGRERWNHLNAVPIQQVYERWVDPYRALWAPRLTRFKVNVEGENHMPQATPVPSVFDRVELEIEPASSQARQRRGRNGSAGLRLDARRLG
ncbi:MAG: metalloregulator ArsR/SmtB family transcription factor [Acidobacteria bacterium]|nr:metalloregulator ArsR/SmtB family transcription factor [Acidobacteriota bacterium]